MAETTPLQTTLRDDTLNPRQLRSAGFIPATLYGPGREPVSIQVREEEFVRLYGRQRIKHFLLDGLEGNLMATAHQVQVHPVSQKVLNIEFLSKAS
jgi:ribosomal protein L25 (general stress protein Ctc)